MGQIRRTNTLVLHAGQNGVVALELLTTHTSGAPVVDDRNEFIGFISEFDVLRALEAGQDLSKLTAEDIMVHDRRRGEDDGGEALAESSREAEWSGGLLRHTTRPSAGLDRTWNDGRRLMRANFTSGKGKSIFEGAGTRGIFLFVQKGECTLRRLHQERCV